jgi:hypothetical protein
MLANKSNGFYERDQKHYVSVTTVLKVLDSYALGQWRLQTGCVGVVHNVLMELDQLLRTQDMAGIIAFSKRTDLITNAGHMAQACLQLEFQKAVGKGSDIHAMIEDYLKGTTVVVDDSVKFVWEKIKEFLDGLALKPKAIEKHLISSKGFAGTLDCLAPLSEEQVAFLKPYLYGKEEIKPGLIVWDWKSRNSEDGFYPDSGYQIGAYMGAVNEEAGSKVCEQGIIVNINKRTGGIRVKPYSLDPWYAHFLSIFDVWKIHASPVWWKKEQTI